MAAHISPDSAATAARLSTRIPPIRFIPEPDELREALMNSTTRFVRATSWPRLAFVPVLAAAPVALADPALQEDQHCLAATSEEARLLGDQLRDQGAYQRAGECYQAAGEFAQANRAFLDAVEPESKATAHELSDQRDQAKTLLHQVQSAFRSGH
jgi:hypothetical protein